jgi:hypothetical protein
VYPQISVNGQYRRLIPSKYPTIDIYEKFGSREMQTLAAELETITNPRLAAKSRITGGATSRPTPIPPGSKTGTMRPSRTLCPRERTFCRPLIRSWILQPTNAALSLGQSFDVRSFFLAPMSRPAAWTCE